MFTMPKKIDKNNNGEGWVVGLLSAKLVIALYLFVDVIYASVATLVILFLAYLTTKL